ncbi:MAG: hypothetical protein AAF085_05990 [Planctomycetota bacterium]
MPDDSKNEVPHPEIASRLDRVVSEANKHRGTEPSQAFVEVLNDLSEYAKRNEFTARRHLANRIHEVTSPTGAGFLALTLGAGVENGASPRETIVPVLQAMLDRTKDISTADENDEYEEIEDEIDIELAKGLDFFGQSIVAHIQRLDDPRKTIPNFEEAVEELERVEHFANGPTWVLALLRMTSGELVVLHGTTLSGVRVKYDNISNCFHFFSLLQGAIGTDMPGGKHPDISVMAKASGDDMGECHDEAWWHFGQPFSKEADLASMVFGEMQPTSIGSVDRTQVILLWPPIMQSRSWDSGFFHPKIESKPAMVNVLSKLTDIEIAEWREKLGLDPAVSIKRSR